MPREFDIDVSKGSITGYYKNTYKEAFSIYKVDDDSYRAEDYGAGWISPYLDIFGAWNLAQSVGVTKEEFEKAFGKIPNRVEVDLDEFVSWFFVAGQLPVQIDARRGDTLYTMVIDSIIDAYSDDMIDAFPDYDKDLIKDAVYEYFTYNTNITNMFDKSVSSIKIFENVLLPVYGDYIEFDKNKQKVIILDYDSFYKFNKESYSDLYEAVYYYVSENANYSIEELSDFVLNYVEKHQK